ncbi:MAG: succinyl-diaminopimelate desuccinylase [Pseudomonadota bacterium]
MPETTIPMPTDPVELTRALVRCPSVTPQDGGAIELLSGHLEEVGFECTRVDRGGIANLYARWGARGARRTFGFNGHTDVVPAGDERLWTYPPFSGEVRDGVLWGRGAADMKSGVAAFASAAMDLARQTPPDGAIVLAITGDEEGDAKDGTRALLDWMDQSGERMTVCLVGEPTCPTVMGEMIKIGRRGSLTAWITFTGTQGHAAYPHLAANPIPGMAALIDRLSRHALDTGTDHFDATTLTVVTVDTGNQATNVIPSTCRSTINIRFNDTHSGASLSDWLRNEATQAAAYHDLKCDIEIKISGESFVTPPGDLSALVARAVEAETGVSPVLSTSGGTSDARFIKTHCPVVEFGLVGQTMHQVDERVPVAQIEQLKAIYGRILKDYFA